MSAAPALLEAEHLSRSFRMGGVLSRNRIEAVADVSFTLAGERPEILSIIGESGSGKTTLARMILGLVAPSSGAIRFLGEDVGARRGRASRLAFMAKVQPIFQNPFESFNPMRRVERYLRSTARRFSAGEAEQPVDTRMDEALRKVGLSLDEVRGRFPHELSGGQLQRAAVARALIPAPRLIVADEPVSMVDASLRMSIVNLFRALTDELGVSIVYITHDLATAYYISDRIAIMHRGRFVETGPARAVLDSPRDPYSIRLKQAVLSPEDAARARLGAAPAG